MIPLTHSVRNHGGIPDIDEDAFELEIGGLVNKSVKLTMKELKDATKFPWVSSAVRAWDAAKQPCYCQSG